jgi:hypothetical protein
VLPDTAVKGGRVVAACLLALTAGSACLGRASAAVDPAALAQGVSVETVCVGKLDALPSGTVFVRIQAFVQPANSSFHSRSHVAACHYIASGVEEVIYQDGSAINLVAGQGFFQVSQAHTHANPGTVANHWYVLAVWPSSARGLPPVNSLAQLLYDSEDLSARSLPPGAYVETLQLVRLAGHGHTAAERHTGVAAIIVLSGRAEVHEAGGSIVTIGSDNGTRILPGAAGQVYDAGVEPVTYLVLFVTQVGRPFVTPLNRPV